MDMSINNNIFFRKVVASQKIYPPINLSASFMKFAKTVVTDISTDVISYILYSIYI